MAKQYHELRRLMAYNDVKQDYIANKLKDSNGNPRSTKYVNQRFTGKYPWTMDDVYTILDLFNIPDSELLKYFPRDGIERDEGNKTDFRVLRFKRIS